MGLLQTSMKAYCLLFHSIGNTKRRYKSYLVVANDPGEVTASTRGIREVKTLLPRAASPGDSHPELPVWGGFDIYIFLWRAPRSGLGSSAQVSYNGAYKITA